MRALALLLCSCAYVHVTPEGTTGWAIGQAKAEHCWTAAQPPGLPPEMECVTIQGGPISAGIAGVLGAIAGALIP